MDITALTVGSLQTNCYLLESDNDCVIIDPGDEADFISSVILEKKIKPQAVLLTHGHYDHVLGCLELKLNFNIPIYLHSKDLPIYQSAPKSSEYWSGGHSFKLPKPDYALSDNQTLSFGSLTLQVIHTPGHTPGSVCFLTQPPVIFTGDLLFASGIGRTDFSYSNPQLLRTSLRKLESVPPDTLIYPGHEEYAVCLDDALKSLHSSETP